MSYSRSPPTDSVYKRNGDLETDLFFIPKIKREERNS